MSAEVPPVCIAASEINTESLALGNRCFIVDDVLFGIGLPHILDCAGYVIIAAIIITMFILVKGFVN